MTTILLFFYLTEWYGATPTIKDSMVFKKIEKHERIYKWNISAMPSVGEMCDKRMYDQKENCKMEIS